LFILIYDEEKFGKNLVRNRKLSAERDEYVEFCVQPYWCTVIYSTGNCVYSCTGVLL